MKLLNFRALATAAMCTVCMSAMAQEPDYTQPQWAKYGATPEERETNFKAYSFFNEEYTAKNYADARVNLKHLLSTIPAVSPNVYIRGITMYKNLIARERDPKLRMTYIDSLLILHDLRMENFGSDKTRGTHYILGEKIKDQIKYNPKEVESAISLTNHAINTAGSNLNPQLMPIYFNYLVTMYNNDLVETETILGEYQVVSAMLDGMPEDTKNLATYKDQVEKLLIASGAASCENLEAIFKPQFEAEPDNKELVAKIVGQLKKMECTSEFQLAVAEKYYQLEPSSSAAAALATAFNAKKDYEKAITYYTEAIEGETDNDSKVALALSAAGANLMAKRIPDAIKFARMALDVNPESGLGYFLLAQAQAQGIGCGDEFQKQAAFWIVVDNLYKAKRYIAEDQVEQINSAINAYSANFPVSEEIFFRDLQKGASYTVRCGAVSGTTTVRPR